MDCGGVGGGRSYLVGPVYMFVPSDQRVPQYNSAIISVVKGTCLQPDGGTWCNGFFFFKVLSVRIEPSSAMCQPGMLHLRP